jgi:REP-associated tyrosine transposase
MKYGSEKHHRRSLRLDGYDYSQPGAYFVTICTGNRECLFGEVIDDEVRLNLSGRMVERWWRELPRKFRGIDIDAHVVMPNHIHGIIVMAGGAVRVSPNEGGHMGPPLPRIVQ